MSAPSPNIPRKALVTGATGFVGSALVRRLVGEGYETAVIVRPSSDVSVLGDEVSRTTVYRHDGGTDGMIEILAEARPTIVFHLASLFVAQHKPEDVTPLIQSNVLFSAQLVEAMSLQGVTRLVNAGTAWQHYEDREYSPVGLYAATKQAFEALLTYYVEATGLQAVTLKLFDTYGPDDRRGKLLSLLIAASKDRRRLDMSPGEQLIDLVYVDDVVDAFIAAGSRLEEGLVSGHEEFSVFTGSPLSLKGLVAAVEEATRAKLDIHWGGRPYRPREVMAPWSKGARIPGWSPEVSLTDGIRRTITANV